MHTTIGIKDISDSLPYDLKTKTVLRVDNETRTNIPALGIGQNAYISMNDKNTFHWRFKWGE